MTDLWKSYAGPPQDTLQLEIVEDIVQGLAFELLGYDSVFLKKSGATLGGFVSSNNTRNLVQISCTVTLERREKLEA